MKLTRKYFLYTTLIQLLAITFINAQPAKTSTLLPPPPNIVVDGNAKEWGDSLRYYNAEKKLNYSIANDKDNLYMAIIIKDHFDQMKILHAGVTFSIDPRGKKKETYSLTFPLTVGGQQLPPIQKDDNSGVTKEDREELVRERITTLRGIKVTGFKDIEDDMITTSNTYGIKAAINYNDNGDLVWEAAIPLSFFHTDDPAKNEWAFNFKINGLTKPTAHPDGEQGPGQNGGGFGGGGGGRGGGGHGGGGRGGHGGNRGGAQNDDAGQGEMFKSEDFWEKFYLAK